MKPRPQAWPAASEVKQKLKPCFLVLAALVHFGVCDQLAGGVSRGSSCPHLGYWQVAGRLANLDQNDPRPELFFFIFSL